MPVIQPPSQSADRLNFKPCMSGGQPNGHLHLWDGDNKLRIAVESIAEGRAIMEVLGIPAEGGDAERLNGQMSAEGLPEVTLSEEEDRKVMHEAIEQYALNTMLRLLERDAMRGLAEMDILIITI